ncbi:hypothetical protein FB107DRAFT_276011 [Schizophyllum commune]
MGGGPCSICNRWAGGPPVSSDLRMRLCGSTHCWTELFSDTYSTETWSLGLFPKGETALYDLPFEASEWIPYVVDDDYVSELTCFREGHRWRVAYGGVTNLVAHAAPSESRRRAHFC